MRVTIYHNPRCSKSRHTLALLEQRGLKPEVVEYLQQPPTRQQLKKILKWLGLKPRDLLRRSEDLYRELNLDDLTLSDEKLISAMAEYPILIERPIVLANGKAAIGRPPEQVLVIL